MTAPLVLVFDTETTGFLNHRKPTVDKSQPHIVQLCAILADADGNEYAQASLIVNPGVPIPAKVAEIHGITDEIAQRYGVSPAVACQVFAHLANRADMMVAHNVDFDMGVMRVGYLRSFGKPLTMDKRVFCTMKQMTPICKIPHPKPRRPGEFKWPKLQEAHQHAFGEGFEGAHDQAALTELNLAVEQARRARA